MNADSLELLKETTENIMKKLNNSADDEDTSDVNIEDLLVTTNLFAYCANNPVSNNDPNGQYAVALVEVAIFAAVAIAIIIYYENSAGKSDPHGDSGRALEKARKQVQELEQQLENATKKEAKKIKQKIKNILEDAIRKAKGETHWR